MTRPKRVDANMVQRLAERGCTDADIGYVLGVSEGYLRTRYRAALNMGRAKLRNWLRRKQLELARKGSVRMLIWLGKQYLGQSDRQTIQQGERVHVVEEVVYPDVETGGYEQNGRSRASCTR